MVKKKNYSAPEAEIEKFIIDVVYTNSSKDGLDDTGIDVDMEF